MPEVFIIICFDASCGTYKILILFGCVIVYTLKSLSYVVFRQQNLCCCFVATLNF